MKKERKGNKNIVQIIKSKKIIKLLILLSALVFCILIISNFLKIDIEKIKDSVVMIEVYDENNNLLATGSGFCAYDKNYIVTNFHVIEGAANFKIITDDKESINVKKILAFNSSNDLALLEIDSTLKPLKIKKNKNLKAGQKVTAIGSPLGELNTVSTGIISNAANDKGIQITASISSGSSGGVLLDNANKVIGVTYATLSEGQNLNYAISIEHLDNLINLYEKKKCIELSDDNYDKYTPNITNGITEMFKDYLTLPQPVEFNGHEENCYSPQDNKIFYNATNKYELYTNAMNKLGEHSMKDRYNNLSYEQQNKVIEYYEYYQTLDVYDWDITGDISKWSIAEFILELKLAQTQELAIIMTEVEENLYSSDALVNYLNETNLEYESKIIINRLFNNNDNRYNNEIVEYFNSQDRISYEQEVALLKFLGMTVDSNGNVYW